MPIDRPSARGYVLLPLAAPHEEGHRLCVLRGSLPDEVLVTAPEHPLAGARLVVDGRRLVNGVPCLIVRLPDGTRGTVEVVATSAAACASPVGGAAVLSVEGLRRLRALVGALLGDRAGT